MKLLEGKLTLDESRIELKKLDEGNICVRCEDEDATYTDPETNEPLCVDCYTSRCKELDVKPVWQVRVYWSVNGQLTGNVKAVCPIHSYTGEYDSDKILDAFDREYPQYNYNCYVPFPEEYSKRDYSFDNKVERAFGSPFDESKQSEEKTYQLNKRDRIKYITTLTKELQKAPYNYSREEANDIALKRASEVDGNPAKYKGLDTLDQLIKKELDTIVTKDEYEKMLNEKMCNHKLKEELTVEYIVYDEDGDFIDSFGELDDAKKCCLVGGYEQVVKTTWNDGNIEDEEVVFDNSVEMESLKETLFDANALKILKSVLSEDEWNIIKDNKNYIDGYMQGKYRPKDLKMAARIQLDELTEDKKDDKKSDKKDDKKASKKGSKKEKEDEEDIDIEDKIDIDVEDDKDLPDVDVDDMLSLDDIDIDVDEPIIDEPTEEIPQEIVSGAKLGELQNAVRDEFGSIDHLKSLIATITLDDENAQEGDEDLIDIINGAIDLKYELIGMLNKGIELLDGETVELMDKGEERAEDILDDETDIDIDDIEVDDGEDVFGGGQDLEITDKFDINRADDIDVDSASAKSLFDIDDEGTATDEIEDDVVIKDKKPNKK